MRAERHRIVPVCERKRTWAGGACERNGVGAERKAERNGVKRSGSGAESGIAGDAVRCDCDGAKSERGEAVRAESERSELC